MIIKYKALLFVLVSMLFVGCGMVQNLYVKSYVIDNNFDRLMIEIQQKPEILKDRYSTSYNGISNDDLTLLQFSLLAGNEKVVKYLLNNDLVDDINHFASYGKDSTLYFALSYKPEMIDLLIQKGLDIHKRNKYDINILHTLAVDDFYKKVKSINPDTLKYVLSLKLDVNHYSTDVNETPLSLAMQYNTEYVGTFIKAGAILDKRVKSLENYQSSLLTSVLNHNDLEALNLLLKKKIITRQELIDATDAKLVYKTLQDNRTDTLSYLVKKRYLSQKTLTNVLNKSLEDTKINDQTIMSLLKKGAKPGFDKRNVSSIMSAVRSNRSLLIIKEILKRSKNVDRLSLVPNFKKIQHMDKALYYSMKSQGYSDEEMGSPYTTTPIKFAIEYVSDSSKLLALMKKSQRIKSYTDYKGNTYMHMAGFFKREDAIRYLHSKGVKFNTQNKEGETPVHMTIKINDSYLGDAFKEPRRGTGRVGNMYSEEFNQIWVLTLMMEAQGANMGLENKQGESPIDYLKKLGLTFKKNPVAQGSIDNISIDKYGLLNAKGVKPSIRKVYNKYSNELLETSQITYDQEKQATIMTYTQYNSKGEKAFEYIANSKNHHINYKLYQNNYPIINLKMMVSHYEDLSQGYRYNLFASPNPKWQRIKVFPLEIDASSKSHKAPKDYYEMHGPEVSIQFFTTKATTFNKNPKVAWTHYSKEQMEQVNNYLEYVNNYKDYTLKPFVMEYSDEGILRDLDRITYKGNQ